MIAPGFNSQSPLDEETPNKKTVQFLDQLTQSVETQVQVELEKMLGECVEKLELKRKGLMKIKEELNQTK